MSSISQKIQESSDYFKAVFGRRPPHNMEALEAWEMAAKEMDRLKSTPAGRNALRRDGWLLEGDSLADALEAAEVERNEEFTAMTGLAW